MAGVPSTPHAGADCAECPECGAIYQKHYATCLVDGAFLEPMTSPAPPPARRAVPWLPLLLGPPTAAAGLLALVALVGADTSGAAEEGTTRQLTPTQAVDPGDLLEPTPEGTATHGPTNERAGGELAPNEPPPQAAEVAAEPTVIPRPPAAPVPSEVATTSDEQPPVKNVTLPSASESGASEGPEEPTGEAKSFRTNDLKNPFD